MLCILQFAVVCVYHWLLGTVHTLLHVCMYVCMYVCLYLFESMQACHAPKTTHPTDNENTFTNGLPTGNHSLLITLFCFLCSNNNKQTIRLFVFTFLISMSPKQVYPPPPPLRRPWGSIQHTTAP